MSTGFPENFLWGSATSSHQIEGNNVNNDWWEWERSGHTEPSGEACDHYHRFKEDFGLAKQIGHNTHRFCLEWSRLEKEEGVWDKAEWDHYKAVVDELLELGIEPVVTLNHFTMPIWFAKKGRWLNPDSVRLFTRYAVKAMEELGGRVKWWLTFNEPCVLAFGSYLNSKWPPEKMSFDDALVTIKNLLKSHVSSYVQMKNLARSTGGKKDPMISVAKAVTAFHPCSPLSPMDRLVTFLKSNFYNHSFIRSAISGRSNFFPFWNEELEATNTLDFISLNYYTREFLYFKRSFPENLLGEVCRDAHHNVGKRTEMGWEIYPEGLYELIKSFSRYDLPIFITENGIAADDDVRKEFIRDHLFQVLRAVNEGMDVIGYLYWSLLDNFEWAEGYRPRFGLLHVDYKTQERTIKDSARYFSEIIRSGKI